MHCSLSGRRLLTIALLALIFSAAPLFALGCRPPAVLSRIPLSADAMEQWKLPAALREISGLASTSDGRLLAHGDERAVIFELDYSAGKIVKSFAFGSPAVRGDFEGIAVRGDEVFLVTRDGKLLFGSEGGDRKSVGFAEFNTNLGKQCEIEGLDYDPAREVLLIVCKEGRTKRRRNRLTIFAWSPSTRRVIDEQTVSIPLDDILDKLNSRDFNPSGIALDAVSGHLVVIAARQRALVELTRAGELIEVLRLPLARQHRQAEGIALTRDGRLILADEGGNGKARLAVYGAGSEE